MESKEELISKLKEREEYLESEWYQLGDIIDEMGGPEILEESESRDAKDILTAFTAIWKALKLIRCVIDRNK